MYKNNLIKYQFKFHLLKSQIGGDIAEELARPIVIPEQYVILFKYIDLLKAPVPDDNILTLEYPPDLLVATNKKSYLHDDPADDKETASRNRKLLEANVVSGGIGHAISAEQARLVASGKFPAAKLEFYKKQAPIHVIGNIASEESLYQEAISPGGLVSWYIDFFLPKQDLKLSELFNVTVKEKKEWAPEFEKTPETLTPEDIKEIIKFKIREYNKINLLYRLLEILTQKHRHFGFAGVDKSDPEEIKEIKISRGIKKFYTRYVFNKSLPDINMTFSDFYSLIKADNTGELEEYTYRIVNNYFDEIMAKINTPPDILKLLRDSINNSPEIRDLSIAFQRLKIIDERYYTIFHLDDEKIVGRGFSLDHKQRWAADSEYKKQINTKVNLINRLCDQVQECLIYCIQYKINIFKRYY